jgi:hypothetical protein
MNVHICEYFTMEHLISIPDLKGTEKLVNSFVAGTSIDEKATSI